MTIPQEPRPPEIPGYVFVRKLGDGSEAHVYLYMQPAMSRMAAVKVSRTPVDPTGRDGRRHREALFMRRLSGHPNIVPVYDAGVTDSGHGYTVFAYVEGGSCGRMLRTGTFDPDRTLSIGIALASALASAHRKGIIHRDVKPANILFSTEGTPMLSDFGIAKNLYAGRRSEYSVPWAAPEVLSHRSDGDDSTDVYSLGATLFAMLSGASPYEHGYGRELAGLDAGARRNALGRLIVKRPLPELGRPDVPETICAILRKALSKDAEHRYYSALEFARAMQRAQYELYGRADPTVVAGEPPYPRTIMRPRRLGASSSASQPARRKYRIVPVAVAATMLAGTALAFTCVVVPKSDSVSMDGGVRTGLDTTRDSDMPHVPEDDPIASGRVPEVEDLSGRYSPDGDSVTFTWTNPDPEDGDSYVWSPVGDDGVDREARGAIVRSESIRVDAADGPRTCIQVSLVRENRRMSDTPSIACVAKP